MTSLNNIARVSSSSRVKAGRELSSRHVLLTHFQKALKAFASNDSAQESACVGRSQNKLFPLAPRFLRLGGALRSYQSSFPCEQST